MWFREKDQKFISLSQIIGVYSHELLLNIENHIYFVANTFDINLMEYFFDKYFMRNSKTRNSQNSNQTLILKKLSARLFDMLTLGKCCNASTIVN